MEELIRKLREIGLNSSEVRVYLYLLQNGMSSAPQIARVSGILRTNCYYVLENLRDKELVQEHRKGTRRQYSARDPRALFASLERKKELVEQILPDLQALLGSQSHKPRIRFYDGTEEVKQLYLEILAAERVRAIGSVKAFFDFDEEFAKYFTFEIKKRRIIFSDILTHASREKKEFIGSTIGSIYEARFLPFQSEDVPTDLLSWDDNLAIIALKQPVFGTLLTNTFLAQTFRVIFDVLWEKLPRT